MSKITIKKSVLLELMKKSGVDCKKCVKKSANDTRFEEFKKQILEHLDSLEKDENELKKSLIAFETTSIEKAGYPVGTIREWKGKKYIKIAPGKWRPKYDGNTRGAKMAIAALKRKAAQCTDSKQLLQLILENRERFSDENGRPLPFVKELSDYVSGLNDKIESSAKTPKKEETPKHKNEKKDGYNKKLEELIDIYSENSEQWKKGAEPFDEDTKKFITDFYNKNASEIDEVDKNRIGNSTTMEYLIRATVGLSVNSELETDSIRKPTLNDIKKLVGKHLSGYIYDVYSSPITRKYLSEFSRRILENTLNQKKTTKEPTEEEKRQAGIDIMKQANKRLENFDVDSVEDSKIDDAIHHHQFNAKQAEKELESMKKNNSDKESIELKQKEIDLENGIVEKLEKRKETEDEKHRNRSEAMKGNKNAYKGGSKDEPNGGGGGDDGGDEPPNETPSQRIRNTLNQAIPNYTSNPAIEEMIDEWNPLDDYYWQTIENAKRKAELAQTELDRLKSKEDKDYYSAPLKYFTGLKKTCEFLQREFIKDYLLNGKNAKVLTGNEFLKKDGVTFAEQVSEFFDSQGNVAHSSIGDIILDSKGVQNDKQHGIGRIKAASFAAVKDVLEKGQIILPLDYYNVHNKKQKTGMVAAPIEINGKRYICVVEVISNNIDNKLYVHECFTNKNILDFVASSSVRSDENHISQNQGYIASVLENVLINKTSTPQSGEKSSGISAIRNKYKAAKSVDGEEDSITLPDGTELEGKWKLVEADAPSASHDETTFHKTEGFPANDDGSTINDRDYEHDSAAKEAVIDMSADFDSRALHIDSPVVVSEDGVVISGNNRTMSSKLAARKGTDTKYIEALNKKAKKFGFTSDDVSTFKNPRVVFETNVNGKYSTKQFAKFNQSGKKAQSPVETAVKIAKTVNAKTVESVAEKINQYDTLGELYADNKSMRDVFGTLIESDLIKKTDLPAYYTDESGVTSNGKEFLETVLVGSVINESNIRSLASAGGKEIRQKLVRAIVPLVENKGMKGYSISKELNEAVSIAVDIKKNKKFKDAEEYSKQGVLIGEKPDPIAIEFAKKLEGTQKEFAEFMRGLNGGLRPAANGEADIFLGGVESRDEILSRYMTIKKAIGELFSSFFK